MAPVTIRQFIRYNITKMTNDQLVLRITTGWPDVSENLATVMVEWARAHPGKVIPWFFGKTTQQPKQNYNGQVQPAYIRKANNAILSLLKIGQSDSFILSILHEHYPRVNAVLHLNRVKVINDY